MRVKKNHLAVSYLPRIGLHSQIDKGKFFNPLTLRAAKIGLTILEILYLQKHFIENIWRRNVDHKPNKNSPSNILWLFALFKRYFQKYESSRRHFLEKL